MQDDTTNVNEVEGVVADESQHETPEVQEEVHEEQQEEAAEQSAEEAQESSQEEESEAPQESEEKPPSRREQLRIQTLLKKYGPPPERPAPSQNPAGIDYAKELEADPETIQRLQQDRDTISQSSFNAGLEQAKIIKFETRLEVDEPTVHRDHSWLNPKDKANFDPVRADAINSMYLEFVGYDAGNPAKGIPATVQRPEVRYRDFVEAQIEFAQALLAEQKAATVKNITRQAATTGLRPDGSAARSMNLNKAPQEMSMEELYAAIGQKPPKK